MTFPESFYTIDILLSCALVWSLFQGIRHGFYRELANALALLFLLYEFSFLYPQLMRLWGHAMSLSVLSTILFLVLILLAVALFFVLRFVLDRFLKVRTGVFNDSFSGAVMGVCRGVLLLICILSILSRIPNERVCSAVVSKSMVGQLICERLHSIVPVP